MTDFSDVGDFHDKFGLDNVTHSEPGPRPWNQDLLDFRITCLKEEVDEFEAGVQDGDHGQMADALVDLVYFALGTAQLLGYPWEDIWHEVHRANMKKVRSPDPNHDPARGSHWDVVKPKGWQPPNVEGILKRYSFEEGDRCQEELVHFVEAPDDDENPDDWKRTAYEEATWD